MDAPAMDLVAHSGPLTLTGSLWRPAGVPRGAVVMHPGSGPSDRHNDVLFGEVRPLFLAAGLAVASFDKRGVGGSDGDWREAGIVEQADDLLAGLAALRAAVPDVPVGVYGHSQGGWVVLEVAGRDGTDVSFVVSSSGPAVSPVEQERFALDQSIAPAVAAGELAENAVEPVRAAFAAMVEGWRTFRTFVEGDARLRATADPAALAWLAGVSWRPADEQEWTLAHLLAGYDPAAALARVAVPLLVLYGDDERVVPVEASADVLGRTVRPDLLTLVVLPGGDHRLQQGDPPTLVPELGAAVAPFLDRVLGKPPVTSRSG